MNTSKLTKRSTHPQEARAAGSGAFVQQPNGKAQLRVFCGCVYGKRINYYETTQLIGKAAEARLRELVRLKDEFSETKTPWQIKKILQASREVPVKQLRQRASGIFAVHSENHALKEALEGFLEAQRIAKEMRRVIAKAAFQYVVHSLPSVSLLDLRKIPQSPGIYFVIDEMQVIYVGQAGDLRQRWKGHKLQAELRAKQNTDTITIAYIETSEFALNELEKLFIDHFQPLYNKKGKNTSISKPKKSSRKVLHPNESRKRSIPRGRVSYTTLKERGLIRET